MLEAILTILGLMVFEAVTSIDNAIINASILKKLSLKFRKIFLTWGIIIAVFVVRFLIPLFMIAISINELNLIEVFLKDIFDSKSLKTNESLLLIFGGVFLLHVYLYWLFVEEKKPLFWERFLHKKHSIWFFAICAAILTFIMYLAKYNVWLMLSASLASTTFFILYGLRESSKEGFYKRNIRDLSGLLYLEFIDASFSFDQVVGALAFTRNLLLILIGAGFGAVLVRYFTIKGLNFISRFIYLKNGAMTSIFFLSIIMILESLGVKIPSFLAPILTFIFVGYSFYYNYGKITRKGK